jgi:hypothetical protein
MPSVESLIKFCELLNFILYDYVIIEKTILRPP